jgi:hypothetical protein|nr:MAG TPA: hypothetical protein [Caudoviricetes sp.]
MFLFQKIYKTKDDIVVDVAIFEDNSARVISEVFLGPAVYRTNVCLERKSSPEDILEAMVSGIAKAREVAADWN